MAIVKERPWSILTNEMSQRYHDIRVVGDKISIEIGKPEERQDVLHLSWLQPLYGFDLFGEHNKTRG